MKNSYGYWMDCDFDIGACDCHHNALKHFEASSALAASENFGFAISHLILGAEEIIKALILVRLNAEQDFISDKQKEELFRNHSFKHLNIRDFFSALTKEEQHDYYDNWYDLFTPSTSTNKFRRTGFFLSRTLKLGTIGEQEAESIGELILNANNLKNCGFYVDYRNSWKLPSQLKEEDYDRYANLVQKLRKFIEPLFTTSLGNDDLCEFIYGK
jgi:AbiV family abortive infection protein